MSGQVILAAGAAGHSGVEGAARIGPEDPTFKAVQRQLADKGFMVAAADDLIQRCLPCLTLKRTHHF